MQFLVFSFALRATHRSRGSRRVRDCELAGWRALVIGRGVCHPTSTPPLEVQTLPPGLSSRPASSFPHRSSYSPLSFRSYVRSGRVRVVLPHSYRACPPHWPPPPLRLRDVVKSCVLSQLSFRPLRSRDLRSSEAISDRIHGGHGLTSRKALFPMRIQTLLNTWFRRDGRCRLPHGLEGSPPPARRVGQVTNARKHVRKSWLEVWIRRHVSFGKASMRQDAKPCGQLPPTHGIAESKYIVYIYIDRASAVRRRKKRK
jgi:hypothetical protein